MLASDDLKDIEQTIISFENEYAYQITNDTYSANSINNLKQQFKLLDDATDNESLANFLELLDSSETLLKGRRAIRNQWIAPKSAVKTNYLFTDNLIQLKDAVASLDKTARNKFIDRITAVKANFLVKLDGSNFEAANNKQTATKDECDKILAKKDISGVAVEIKCSSGNLAARFPAIRDDTNHRWFILSENYLHKDNDKNAHEYWLCKAATVYCNKINILENIPEDFVFVENINIDTNELAILAEQLIKLLDL